MGIVSQYPESGVRVEITRADAGPPWDYRGEAVVPDARFAMRATVGPDGAVTVELADGAPPGLSDRVKLIVRAAYRHAKDDGTPPPRRIVRWRADR